MVRLSFEKMHGLGNDYILVDCEENSVEGLDLPDLARVLCRRRFGVGADGLILVRSGGADADFSLRVFNPDGSETGACGTAFRSVARYVSESKGFSAADAGVRLATFARNVHAKVIPAADGKILVEVSMGKAHFRRGEIPVAGDPSDEFLDQLLEVGGEHLLVSAVSLGNPHTVVFCDDVERIALDTLGPAIETLPVFPERTNVHFVQVMGNDELKVQIWERGTGPTLSCGTGACASAAVSWRLGKAKPPTRVLMPGGQLEVDIDGDGEIIMGAEVESVYRGSLVYEA